MFAASRRAAGSALVVALVLASPAMAATITRIDQGSGPVIRYTTASGAIDEVTVGRDSNTGDYGFFGGPRGGTLTAGQGCTGPLLSCPAAPLDFRLLDGDDRLSVHGLLHPLYAEAGTGDDTVTGTTKADEIFGGPGNDTLDGDAGADQIRGEQNDDRFTGAGAGADLSGGPGTDAFVLSTRDSAEITLDGTANDSVGAVSGFNVGQDVEDVTTVGGNDRLTGSAVANRLDAGEGDDTVTGGAGEDTLIGGPGSDAIVARDGVTDTITCGAGTDVATADVGDVVTDCETVLLDRDGDGSNSDADCDDTNPGRHPGLADVPDNGIDEDCQNGDAINLDRDADGYQRPGDCDDATPAVHPGAAEIRGNGVDENCDGVKDPFPRITSGVPYNFKPVRRGRTKVVILAVRDAPVGASIRVSCRGGGCPRRARTVRSKGLKQLKLTSYFTDTLAAGAVIEVRITAPGRIGKDLRFTTRRGKSPRRPKIGCLSPGASRVSACPAGS